MPDPNIANLGVALRARRRERRLSLRDLHELTGVSINTLSRVENGHIPDLKNFQRIVEWLDLPVEAFLETPGEATIPEAIARHLRADPNLPTAAARQIVEMVEEMYHRLVVQQPSLSLHLRSAKTFTPAASDLIVEILGEMQSNLQASGS